MRWAREDGTTEKRKEKEEETQGTKEERKEEEMPCKEEKVKREEPQETARKRSKSCRSKSIERGAAWLVLL